MQQVSEKHCGFNWSDLNVFISLIWPNDLNIQPYPVVRIFLNYWTSNSHIISDYI